MNRLDIQATHVALPLASPIRSAIHRIDTIHVLLTELRDAAGHEGFGAAIAFRPEFVESMKAVVRDLVPLVRELPPERIGAMREAMLQRVNYLGLSGVAIQALSTLDTALWVLLANRARLPLHQLLGSVTSELDAYHGHGLWLGTPTAELGDEARRYMDEGYRAVKLRVGLNDLAADLGRVEAVRRAIGDGIVLMVDANQGQDPLYARRLGHALEAYDVFWYEEPVAYTDLENHARLTAELRVPVATGQSEYLERGMLGYLQARACRILMPDICRMGGVTGWKKAAAHAEAFHTPVSNHMYVEFGAHLQASIPNRTYTDTIDWLAPLFETRVRFEDGRIQLSDEPGIGLALNRKAIERHRVS
jgi:L-alanine-DL-glutamate epimerase-like enolase superfamily enzyme